MHKKPKNTLFLSFISKYESNITSSTSHEYEKTLTDFYSTLELRENSKITIESIDRILLIWEEKGLKSNTIKSKLSGIKKISIQKKKWNISNDEYKKVLNAIKGYNKHTSISVKKHAPLLNEEVIYKIHERNKIFNTNITDVQYFMLLACSCSTRVEEIIDLSWNNISTQNTIGTTNQSYITLFNKSKTSQGDTWELSLKCVCHLNILCSYCITKFKMQQYKSQLIFKDSRETMKDKIQAWLRINNFQNYMDFTFHSFRRTMSSLSFKYTGNLQMVAILGNWSLFNTNTPAVINYIPLANHEVFLITMEKLINKQNNN